MSAGLIAAIWKMNGSRGSRGILNQQTKKKVDRPGETCREIERKIGIKSDRQRNAER